MEILLGMGLLAALEVLAWLGWRSWYRATQPPVQPPPTAEQVANERAFDEVVGTMPRMGRVRLRRHRARGGRVY
jgi:hypothetical protein